MSDTTRLPGTPSSPSRTASAGAPASFSLEDLPGLPTAIELVDPSTSRPSMISELPLVVNAPDANADAVAWARARASQFQADLLTHGGLLFRGFATPTVNTFQEFASVFCKALFTSNGEHPRQSIDGHVYTPVFYPPERRLLWHNENSFNQCWPLKIAFCCLTPAREGGETPLVDSRLVYAHLPAAIRDLFMRKGVTYVRNYGGGVGLDWRTVFGTTDRAEVEARCRADGVAFEWKGRDGLKTWAVRPAAISHPVTHEMSWFNQAQHWHVACLDPDVRASLRAAFREDDLPRTCSFGDGAPIEDAMMDEICAVYQELEVSFPWQRGDIVMLDNVLAAHARNAFAGARKLLVAMGDMASYAEVAAASV